MRGLTIVLVLLNLIYALSGFHLPLPAQTPALPPLDLPALELLPVAAVHPQSTAGALAMEVVPAASPTPLCYRLGPWAQVRLRQQVQARWPGQGHAWEEATSVPTRYWVLAQPAPEQAQALISQAQRQNLKAWRVTQEPWLGQVAFGYFRELPSAERKLTAVQAAGVEARIVPELTTQPRYWFDLPQTLTPTPPDAALLPCHQPAAG